MKKKYIQLGIVTVVFLGMLGAFLLLRKAPGEAAPEIPAAEKIFVVGGEPALDPVQIDVSNESGNYSLVRRTQGGEESDLTVKGWDKLSLDSYALDQTASAAGAMEAKIVIAENAGASMLADYGLDKPRASAKIIYGGNESAEILIGANAPGGEGVYVKRGGDNDVYLVSPSTAEPFLKPDVAYVNKTITATDAEFKGFDKITLSGANYPEPIVIVKTPETAIETAGVSFNTHSLISPVKASVDSQSGLEPLNSVYGLVAADVSAVIGDEPGALRQYGLDEPAAVISVTGPADNPDMTFELRVSKTGADDSLHVIKTGSPVVYELTASSFPWLGLTVFDYMEKSVIMPNISAVSSVTLSSEDKIYEFTLTGEDDNLVVSLNGKELPEVVSPDGSNVSGAQNFRQFYQTMISARYESPADEPLSNEAATLARIEYRYKDGRSNDVVRFYSGPTRRAVVFLNGGTHYLCTLTYVDRLLEDAAKIAAGEAVKSYF